MSEITQITSQKFSKLVRDIYLLQMSRDFHSRITVNFIPFLHIFYTMIDYEALLHKFTIFFHHLRDYKNGYEI